MRDYQVQLSRSIVLYYSFLYSPYVYAYMYSPMNLGKIQDFPEIWPEVRCVATLWNASDARVAIARLRTWASDNA